MNNQKDESMQYGNEQDGVQTPEHGGEPMHKMKRLTEGAVLPVLLKLALPIMGASFVQMAYNLTDMYWVGYIGSEPLSAVGIAGFYIWLSVAFVVLVRVGTEVKVAHRTGARDDEDAQRYAGTGIVLATLIALAYSVLVIALAEPLIDIFNTTASVHRQSVDYLVVVSFGIIFTFLNPVLGAIFNSKGYSAFAFYANLLGTILNFALDPIFILGFGSIPPMGVVGAAVATIFSQMASTLVCLYVFFFKKKLFHDLRIRLLFQIQGFGERAKEVLKLGLAPAVHSAMFTLISIVIGILVSRYGTNANAVQKLGTQIESLSWMTASGISFALTAFIGQNFGAAEYRRVWDGYRIGMALCTVLGIVSTLLLFFLGEPLFRLFISDTEVVQMGGDYLRILALSQLLMCFDITCTGIFNGLGITKLPAVIGVTFNLIRIPMAYFLVTTSLDLNGIWWAITISSWLKGVFLLVFLRRDMRNFKSCVD
ncbi:MAG: MATE family efflux transporter [Bacillota bacterium]|nr:MATE family efflux transporter [Bacillota bacterium]